MLLLSELLTEALASGPPGCRASPPRLTRAGWDCHWRNSFRRICVVSTRFGWRMC
ncbi:hypothetical protein BZL30_2808 [Mycobacterium kansasii]|uniref:Uncharacterized protein n=1 Tax=Mycobacterium kansasii TaxID=1768 RepID=A0A1V3XIK8_MYCKA|nr:hypothetical protein BZL30_2808 [Mycobacterium kansasii]